MSSNCNSIHFSLAGATGTMATFPLEFLKTRLQVSHGVIKFWECNIYCCGYVIVDNWSKLFSWQALSSYEGLC